jgi:drug/metabolite transporter (DMT)-like permease
VSRPAGLVEAISRVIETWFDGAGASPLDATVFAVMLASAFLHASWNAWVKAQPDPGGALAALVIGAGFPNLILLCLAGLPPPVAWGWITLTVALSVGALTLLGAAYREGDFAVAYPLIRGLIPVVLVIAAAPLFNERPSPADSLGVVCVSAGLVAIGWESARRTRTMSLKGLGFAALAAGVTAASVLSDTTGARVSQSPFGYAAAISVLNALGIAAVQARSHSIPKLLLRNWPVATVGAFVSMMSYVMFIWSLMRAPVALVVAVRETSMLFALAIAALMLGERIGSWRWAAVALMFAGVVLIRL